MWWWLMCLVFGVGCSSPTEPPVELNDAEQCVRWETRGNLRTCVEWR